MGFADKLQSKLGNKQELENYDKQAGKALGKDSLSGEIKKQHKEGNLNKENAAKYADDLDKKGGQYMGKENLSGTEHGVGTHLTGGGKKSGAEADGMGGKEAGGAGSKSGTTAGSGSGSGSGAAAAGGAGAGAAGAAGAGAAYGSKKDGSSSASKDPSSGAYGSSGYDTSGKQSSGDYDTSGKQSYGSDDVSGKKSSDVSGSGKKDYDTKEMKENATSGAKGAFGAYKSDDPQEQLKHGKEAAIGGGSAAMGAAAAYGASKHKKGDSADSGTYGSHGKEDSDYTYGSNKEYGAQDSSKSGSQANGSHSNGGGALDFSTGNKQLDQKIAQLDPSVQKQAKDAFNKGYSDAKSAFKT